MSTSETDPLVIRERLTELFKHPNLLPENLLAFLVDYLAVNMPEIPIGHIIGSATSAITPAGVISAYGGTTAPSGWLICDGTAVSRTTYASLFTAISTTYGVGDGSTTFNVPDLRGRVAVGFSSTGPAEVNALGDNDGVAANLRNISHHHLSVFTPGSGLATGAGAGTLSSKTTGDVNNLNYPAYLVTNFIIKT